MVSRRSLVALTSLLLGGLGCQEHAEPSPPVASAGRRQPSAGESAAPPSSALSSDHTQELVTECRPCLLHASAKVSVRVLFSPDSEGHLSRVALARPGQAPEEFAVSLDSLPPGQFVLQAVDLNFDGVLDLALSGVAGTPNASTELFTVESSSVHHVGQLMTPRVDSTRREIVAYEKGGHAGLLFREEVYGWRSGELHLLRDTEQTFEGGSYFRTTREFGEDGKPTRTTRRKVEAPASDNRARPPNK